MHCQVHLSVHAYTNDYLRCTKCEVHDRVRKYVIKCKKKCVPRFLTLEALIYHIKIKNQRAIINYKVRTATKKNKQKKNTHTHTHKRQFTELSIVGGREDDFTLYYSETKSQFFKNGFTTPQSYSPFLKETRNSYFCVTPENHRSMFVF